jgi:Protein of unknown function (DUF3108)
VISRWCRRAIVLGASLALLGEGAAAASAQRAPVPWSVGERLQYDVRFGPIKVGSGSMEVAGIESVRGIETYHTIFRVRGGTIVYRVNDVFESWMDTGTLSSLRFVKDQQEGRKEREARIEIFPDRMTYSENGDPEQPSVANPLDDGSFLYYVRTLPLRPGETYTFDRYFRPDRNPVRIRVLRRERVTVPAGTFDAVVVQPSIKTRGIFSEGGRAEVWISDDADRLILQMKSSLSFGSLNLFLRSREPGPR